TFEGLFAATDEIQRARGLTVLTIGSQSLESRLNESQVHDLVHLDLGSDQTFLEIPLLVVLTFFEIHLAVGREFRSIQADSQQFFISGSGIFSDDIDDVIKGFFLFEYPVVEIELTFEKAKHELFRHHRTIPHQRVRVEQIIAHMAGKSSHKSAMPTPMPFSSTTVIKGCTRKATSTVPCDSAPTMSL